MKHYINNKHIFRIIIGTYMYHIMFQIDKSLLEFKFEIQYGIGYSNLKFRLPF